MIIRPGARREAAAEKYALFGPGPGCHKLTCSVCGSTFFATRPDALYCGYRCRNDAYIARRRERRAAARRKRCEHCGAPFEAKRRDTRYCSNACRQATYRLRVTDRGCGNITTT